jgi:hypothetical protein
MKHAVFTIPVKEKGRCDWLEDAWRVEMQVHSLQSQHFVRVGGVIDAIISLSQEKNQYYRL